APAIFEVSMVGPLRKDSLEGLQSETLARVTGFGEANPTNPEKSVNPTNPTSPGRTKILIDRPASGTSDEMFRVARVVLAPILRQAYRRKLEPADWVVPLQFFGGSAKPDTDAALADPDLAFQRGIRAAIASILVNPHFLLRSETTSAAAANPDKNHGIAPEVHAGRMIASRLSLFLWGSLPDAELLDLAQTGRLVDRDTVADQTRRMLADDRAGHLIDDFCDQWLQLRNLAGLTPDLRRFPDFDDNLRRSMAGETRHLFRDIAGRDRPITTLLRPGYTFLDERLATHYGIGNVRGPGFRKVVLPANSLRGGLLRHASILSVTSYATRTSPTIRGAWVLENLVGTPPPPPPPDVPTLKTESAVATATTLRERLRQHRDQAACASCHALIDPIGFALDRYDALGRYRKHDGDLPIDTRGVLPDGSPVASIDDLEQVLVDHPEWFQHCFTEKLMTYALARIVDHRDQAALRKVVRDAQTAGGSFADFVIGVATSDPMLSPAKRYLDPHQADSP
ncbi:MAG: DUF1592 domain-containing protein, partial [Planctomycetota bacterium]